MRIPNEGDSKALEGLVDSIGLYELLSILAGIVADKAEHIQASYDDQGLAAKWWAAGVGVNEASELEAVKEIS